MRVEWVFLYSGWTQEFQERNCLWVISTFRRFSDDTAWRIFWHGRIIDGDFCLVSLGVGAVVAGAGGRQLEGLDGEGEVLVIGVVGEEAVVDALLQALGLVAGGHQGTRLSGGVALLNPKFKVL